MGSSTLPITSLTSEFELESLLKPKCSGTKTRLSKQTLRPTGLETWREPQHALGRRDFFCASVVKTC